MFNIPKATITPVLWLLPFLGSFLILPVADGLQVASVVSALFGLAAYLLCTGKEIRINTVTLMVIALWGLSLVSVVCSAIPFVSLTYFFFFSAFPLTYLIFQMADARRILMGLRLIIATLSFGSIVQFYYMPDMLKFNGAHWPLEDNNSLAIILAVGGLLFFAETLRSPAKQYINCAGAALCVAGVMTTGAVAVSISFILVSTVFVILARPQNFRPIVAFLVAVVMLMAIMKKSEMSFYYLGNQQTYGVNEVVSFEADSQNRLSGERYMIWKSSVEIIKQHPLIGTGIGTFFLYYPEFRDVNEGSAGYMVHNDLIQFTLEMGVVAPLIAISIILLVLIGFGRIYITEKEREGRFEVLTPFSAFGLLVGYSLINFNFYILPTLMMIGYFLSLFSSKLAVRDVVLPKNIFARQAMAVTIGTIFLFVLWACSLSEYHTNQAMKSLEREDVQLFSDHLNAADEWGMGQNGRAILQAAKFAAIVNQKDKAIELLDQAQKVNPRLLQIYTERARLFLDQENLSMALEQAQQALQLDRSSIIARMILADVLERMGRHDEAYQILKDGLVGYMRARDPKEYYQRLLSLSMKKADTDTNKEVLKRMSNAK